MKAVRPIWMDVQNGSLYPVFDVLKGTGADGTFTYPDDAADPYTDGQGEERVDGRPGRRARGTRSGTSIPAACTSTST